MPDPGQSFDVSQHFYDSRRGYLISQLPVVEAKTAQQRALEQIELEAREELDFALKFANAVRRTEAFRKAYDAGLYDDPESEYTETEVLTTSSQRRRREAGDKSTDSGDLVSDAEQAAPSPPRKPLELQLVKGGWASGGKVLPKAKPKVEEPPPRPPSAVEIRRTERENETKKWNAKVRKMVRRWKKRELHVEEVADLVSKKNYAVCEESSVDEIAEFVYVTVLQQAHGRASYGAGPFDAGSAGRAAPSSFADLWPLSDRFSTDVSREICVLMQDPEFLPILQRCKSEMVPAHEDNYNGRAGAQEDGASPASKMNALAALISTFPANPRSQHYEVLRKDRRHADRRRRGLPFSDTETELLLQREEEEVPNVGTTGGTGTSPHGAGSSLELNLSMYKVDLSKLTKDASSGEEGSTESACDLRTPSWVAETPPVPGHGFTGEAVFFNRTTSARDLLVAARYGNSVPLEALQAKRNKRGFPALSRDDDEESQTLSPAAANKKLLERELRKMLCAPKAEPKIEVSDFRVKFAYLLAEISKLDTLEAGAGGVEDSENLCGKNPVPKRARLNKKLALEVLEEGVSREALYRLAVQFQLKYLATLVLKPENVREASYALEAVLDEESSLVASAAAPAASTSSSPLPVASPTDVESSDENLLAKQAAGQKETLRLCRRLYPLLKGRPKSAAGMNKSRNMVRASSSSSSVLAEGAAAGGGGAVAANVEEDQLPPSIGSSDPTVTSSSEEDHESRSSAPRDSSLESDLIDELPTIAADALPLGANPSEHVLLSDAFGRLLRFLLQMGLSDEARELWQCRPLRVNNRNAKHVLRGCCEYLKNVYENAWSEETALAWSAYEEAVEFAVLMSPRSRARWASAAEGASSGTTNPMKTDFEELEILILTALASQHLFDECKKVYDNGARNPFTEVLGAGAEDAKHEGPGAPAADTMSLSSFAFDSPRNTLSTSCVNKAVGVAVSCTIPPTNAELRARRVERKAARQHELAKLLLLVEAAPRTLTDAKWLEQKLQSEFIDEVLDPDWRGGCCDTEPEASFLPPLLERIPPDLTTRILDLGGLPAELDFDLSSGAGMEKLDILPLHIYMQVVNSMVRNATSYGDCLQLIYQAYDRRDIERPREAVFRLFYLGCYTPKSVLVAAAEKAEQAAGGVGPGKKAAGATSGKAAKSKAKAAKSKAKAKAGGSVCSAAKAASKAKSSSRGPAGAKSPAPSADHQKPQIIPTIFELFELLGRLEIKMQANLVKLVQSYLQALITFEQTPWPTEFTPFQEGRKWQQKVEEYTGVPLVVSDPRSQELLFQLCAREGRLLEYKELFYELFFKKRMHAVELAAAAVAARRAGRGKVGGEEGGEVEGKSAVAGSASSAASASGAENSITLSELGDESEGRGNKQANKMKNGRSKNEVLDSDGESDDSEDHADAETQQKSTQQKSAEIDRIGRKRVNVSPASFWLRTPLQYGLLTVEAYNSLANLAHHLAKTNAVALANGQRISALQRKVLQSESVEKNQRAVLEFLRFLYAHKLVSPVTPEEQGEEDGKGGGGQVMKKERNEQTPEGVVAPSSTKDDGQPTTPRSGGADANEEDEDACLGSPERRRAVAHALELAAQIRRQPEVEDLSEATAAHKLTQLQVAALVSSLEDRQQQIRELTRKDFQSKLPKNL